VLDQVDVSTLEDWGLDEFKMGLFDLNGWHSGFLASWINNGED